NTQAIIWLCLLVSIAILFIGTYKYDRKLLLILTAMIFQYIPWIAVPRIAFIYHYFSIVPFLILAIVYVIKKFVDKYDDAKYFAYVYLGIVLALFILFYPGLSGLEVPVSYMKYLKWFNTWYF
ncbi:MAG: phospholipid carrier-dependent glycosyltransferase, partial [Bacillota bacterium]